MVQGVVSGMLLFAAALVRGLPRAVLPSRGGLRSRSREGEKPT